MKILLLTRYDDLGASSRVRFYQYLPYLESQGIYVDVAPLLDNEYLTRLYSDAPLDWLRLAKAYLKRVLTLRRVSQYDLIWLEYEALPWLPAWMEMKLGLARQTFVVEYDDAIFHRYDLNRNRVVRALLRNKIDMVMRNASMVIVGNQYLADRANRVGAPKVEIVPTVVDTERYRPWSHGPWRYARQGLVTIGWIGSPATQHYLDLILPVISKLCAMGLPIRLAVVGGHLDVTSGLPVINLPWSEAGEVEAIQAFDIGIMPLLDSPWERGKCGYKLIQYMACGKPVVASPVGVNRQIVSHGVNGFLAESTAQWGEALTRLLGDADLRLRMGAAGRALVEQSYSVQVTAPRLAALLRMAAELKACVD